MSAVIELPPMQIHYVEQGTPEWLELRTGVPTASEFAAIMTQGRGGAPSQTRLTYLYKVIGERLTGDCSAVFSGNEHTRRGHELEPEARDLYCMLRDTTVRTVGFISRGKYAGASPDSLVGDDGLLEIKTKLPHLQIPVLLAGKLPEEHRAQVQGQLWVSEREWCDFLSYWPGLRPFLLRVYRDDDYIEQLASAVAEFHEQLNEIMEKVRA